MPPVCYKPDCKSICLELEDCGDLNFKQYPIRTKLELWERKNRAENTMVKKEKENTDSMYSSWKGKISKSWREILKKGQPAVRQENSINIMQERASKEMSRIFQENRKRKVWNIGTGNCIFAVERAVCIPELKRNHYQKSKSTWVWGKNEKAWCLATTNISPHKTPRILIRENRADPQPYFLPHIQPTNYWEFQQPELTVTF